MKTRRGTTLVELMTCMVVGGAIMLIAIGVLQQSLALSTMARTRFEHSQAMLRLARQFRSDMNIAVKVTQSSDQDLKIEIGDETIVEYMVEPSRIYRRAIGPENLNAMELYQLHEDSRITMEQKRAAQSVRLTIRTMTESIQHPMRLELDVVVNQGRWLPPTVANFSEPVGAGRSESP